MALPIEMLHFPDFNSEGLQNQMFWILSTSTNFEICYKKHKIGKKKKFTSLAISKKFFSGKQKFFDLLKCNFSQGVFGCSKYSLISIKRSILLNVLFGKLSKSYF